MKFLVTSILSVSVLAASTGFAAESARERALRAFEASSQVKAASEKLHANGFVRPEEAEAVTVSGGCGFAGCDASVLVVQRFDTEGANTRTQSVTALVRVPAVGETSLSLVSLAPQRRLELPWTMSSDSTQAVLKKALYDALKADQQSPFPMGRIKGDYSKVEVADGSSKVTCQERKAPGMIQVQQFACTIEAR